MPGESTTPDLVELTRRQLEAVNRRDMDAAMSRFPPDGVHDTSPDGLGVYEGPAAIRALLGDWWDAFEELALEPEDVLDLGQGIVCWSSARAPVRPTARVMCNDAKRTSWNG